MDIIMSQTDPKEIASWIGSIEMIHHLSEPKQIYD